jgi:hypothetical protein
VISVILYGRNDAHGYNLHRRAALSLNCLAEVLTHEDDEILFVDYNTPGELPTFVEAISDTLTQTCRDRLRVFRVPAELHRDRFSERTHLPAVEPVCRNVAARRANPANRWLLSTNTDMIVLPRDGSSVSDVCGDLEDGFYALPRFELPEWLWEQLPRSDPRQALAELMDLGPRLRLDEPTLSHAWVRFDAPGDFQLVLRDDLYAIDGFNEEMLLGWHVDSNLSRRMFLRRGSIESLEGAAAGYHCNHNRTPTVYIGESRVENDHSRYYNSVDRDDLPAQRETWGLADVALDEISLANTTGTRLTTALVSAIPSSPSSRTPSQLLDERVSLSYDAGHVLPFVADSLAVSPRPEIVGYLGANTALRDMLQQVVVELGCGDERRLITASDQASAGTLAERADLLIVDFGLDADAVHGTAGSERALLTTEARKSLRSVIEGFQLLVERERARVGQRRQPRRFVLVNSRTGYTDAYVLSQLDCSHTTMHSRVRRATVKPKPTTELNPIRDLCWDDPLETRQPLTVHPGRPLAIARLDSGRGFPDGWAFPDVTAVWTRGPRAELRLASRTDLGQHDLAISFGRVGVPRGSMLTVGLSVDGTPLASRSFPGGTGSMTWRTRIPRRAAGQPFTVTLEFENPPYWQTDDRMLGLHVRSLGIERGGLVHGTKRVAATARTAFARLAHTARARTL